MLLYTTCFEIMLRLQHLTFKKWVFDALFENITTVNT